jgi:probable HAF family extracellular repeat protein
MNVIRIQNQKRIATFMVAAATLLAATVRAQPTTAQQYAIIDLGTLGGESSQAAGLNNLGEVVGSAQTPDGASHAFLYRNAQMFDLGTLPGGTSSEATGINDRGQVVGSSGINAYGPQFREFTQGVVWDNAERAALGALYCRCSFNARYGTSRALAISGSGQIVGDSETNRGDVRHAFLWVGRMGDLGAVLSPSEPSYAYDINELGEVVGVVGRRAFLWRDGAFADLGTPPGHTASAARAINGKGQTVGESAAGDGGPRRAVLWDQASVRDLGTLAGDVSSEALDINVDGLVVGRSGNVDLTVSRAVLWQDGLAIDLNTRVAASGWVLSLATGINDRGQIAGVGLHDGRRRAFLLEPF